MACQYHPEKPVVASCRECGALICEACAVELNEKTICKQCIEHLYKEKKHGGRTVPSRHGYHVHERARFVSPFLVFMISMLPGAAHMYMGLMKRGLFIMCGFFLSTILTSHIGGFVGMIIPIVFIMSFFDANNTRRKINRGEHVDDEIESIKDLVKANKTVFAILGGLLLFSIVFDGISGIMGHFRFAAGRDFLPYVIIGAGIYFLSKNRKRRDDDKSEHGGDINYLENDNGKKE